MAAALDLYAAEPGAVLLFPAPDLLPYERIAPDPHDHRRPPGSPRRPRRPPTTADSANPQSAIRNPQLVVASAAALMMPTFAPADFRWATHRLSEGDTVDVNDLLAHWVDLGYQPASVVEEPG